MCLYYPYISSVQCVHVCHHQFLDFLARHKLHAEYKTNCTFMKMTRGTNLMQQLWFIIINYSTCFGHLLPIFRSAGCVLLHVVFSTRCCGCGPKELVCSLVHCVCVCAHSFESTGDINLRHLTLRMPHVSLHMTQILLSSISSRSLRSSTDNCYFLLCQVIADWRMWP